MTALFDLLLQTLRSLRAHALRFTLTSLGIFWGAAMLTFLSASSTGIEDSFRQQLARTGPKVVWVMPGVVIKDRVGERGARVLEFEAEDVERVARLDIAEQASVDTELWNRLVRAGRRTKLLTVSGLDAAGAEIRNFQTAAGRMFLPYEVERGSRVAFLGADSAERLFGRAPAVGKTIHIDSVPFRVVGVAHRKGDQLIYFGDADDRIVLVPQTAARRWLSHTDVIQKFLVAPRTREESEIAIQGIRSVLSLHHRFEPASELALAFVNVKEVTNILDALFLGLKVFLVGVGLVTLLVGAVGVMNIMLVVVGERIQEIGLRKAIGASNRAVFALFVTEAAAVSTLSGVCGSVAGLGLIELVGIATPADSRITSQPVFDLQTTLLVVVSLILVGMVSGFLPALRAARVAPAESLRAR
jgi:putative ABC transport system permease protein